MGLNVKHMRTGSAIMQNNDRNADFILSDRLYGEHYPDSFLDLPQPIWHSSLRTLGDYIGRLHEVDQQPHQSYVACVPAQPSYANNTASCGSADTDNTNHDPRNNTGQSSAFIKCPDSGKLCARIDYPNDCNGDSATQGQSALSSGSDTVSGVICETGATASQCVSRSEHSAGNTEQHTDAGHDNDEPASTTRL
jgi:hypothetical protein